jgi:hypothetical protein
MRTGAGGEAHAANSVRRGIQSPHLQSRAVGRQHRDQGPYFQTRIGALIGSEESADIRSHHQQTSDLLTTDSLGSNAATVHPNL